MGGCDITCVASERGCTWGAVWVVFGLGCLRSGEYNGVFACARLLGRSLLFVARARACDAQGLREDRGFGAVCRARAAASCGVAGHVAARRGCTCGHVERVQRRAVWPCVRVLRKVGALADVSRRVVCNGGRGGVARAR